MQKRYSLVWYVLMCDTNAFLTCADTQQLMYIASLSSVIMDIFLSKDVLKFSNLLWKSVYSFLQYLNLFSQRNNTQNWPQKRIPACRAGHILNAWFKTFCTHHQHYGPIIFTKLLHQTSFTTSDNLTHLSFSRASSIISWSSSFEMETCNISFY